jgi:hypothetical protein
VPLLIRDEVALRQRLQLRKARVLPKPELLDPCLLEGIRLQNDIEQLSEPLVLVSRSGSHADPRAIGGQFLLLLVTPTGSLHIFGASTPD